jgi:hypothetical protein
MTIGRGIACGRELLLADQAGDAVIERRVQVGISVDQPGALGIGQGMVQCPGMPLVILGHFY